MTPTYPGQNVTTEQNQWHRASVYVSHRPGANKHPKLNRKRLPWYERPVSDRFFNGCLIVLLALLAIPGGFGWAVGFGKAQAVFYGFLNSLNGAGL